MLLTELLHPEQVDEEVGEWIIKGIIAIAMAATIGGGALGFGKSNTPHDIQTRLQRLLLNASLKQISRIREAVRKKSVEDLKRELDALRAQTKSTNE